MKSNRWFFIIAICLGVVQLASAQTFSVRSPRGAAAHQGSTVAMSVVPVTVAMSFDEFSDGNDDPSYKLYKEGYNLILDEEWKDAVKKLDEVLSKYSGSEFIDDAKYWSAYALKHLDRKKAIEAYEKFTKNYPTSSYYDDAMADLDELRTTVYTVSDGAAVKAYSDSKGFGYSYRLIPGMRKLKKGLSMQEMTLSRLPRVPVAMTTPRLPREEKLDPETQLKMDALYAIGELKEDEKSYQTLRDIAVDPSQPMSLRDAAMDALSDFKKHDIVSVYVDIAKRDTSEEMQNVAIEYIGEHSKDKNKCVEILAGLFTTLPKQRNDQLKTILYSVAEVGNDKAVDFLAGVARSNRDYEMRSDAIYYLGNIGGEKARAALYDVLKGK